MLSVICFSKDRPLQLDAFLASLHFFSGIAYRQISIIYKTSAHIAYDEVIGAYPDVVWIRESDFIADVSSCVAQSGECIMLCCDDMVFKQHFSPAAVIKALEDRPDALGFNLRLGANLHSLPRLKVDGELLSWFWRLPRKNEWYFAWDLSGCVYRREFVAALLTRYHKLTNPNRLEQYIADDIPYDTQVSQNSLLCFWTSKCIVPTVNRVQDEFKTFFDNSGATDPATLYTQYQAGKRLYWLAFALKSYGRSHITGRDFILVDAAAQPGPAECERLLAATPSGMSARSLAIRIALWNVPTRVKYLLRPFIPQRLLALAWKWL